MTTLVSSGVSTGMVRLQPVPVAGQLLPAAAEVSVLTISLSPVSGLLTVSEYVTIAVAPTARSPVQVTVPLANDTLPVVAAASLP